MNNREFFQECIKVLDTEGWYQGGMAEGIVWGSAPDSTTRRCIVGITRCVERRNDNSPHWVHYMPKLSAAIPGLIGSVEDWNDAPHRTIDDIRKAFEAAAEME